MPPKVRVTGPDVVAFAEQHSVDLSTVSASSADGRVSREDAFRAAITDRLGLERTASNETIVAVAGFVHARAERVKAAAHEQEAARAKAAAAQPTSTRESAHHRRIAASRGPAFALNPAADRIRVQAEAGLLKMPSSPPPTLFAAGDLPTFTASGVPPEALLEVPWEARHAMAAAATTAEAYAIAADCAGLSISEGGDFYDHPGNADYQARVQKWQASAITDEDIETAFEQQFPGLLGPA